MKYVKMNINNQSIQIFLLIKEMKINQRFSSSKRYNNYIHFKINSHKFINNISNLLIQIKKYHKIKIYTKLNKIRWNIKKKIIKNTTKIKKLLTFKLLIVQSLLNLKEENFRI